MRSLIGAVIILALLAGCAAQRLEKQHAHGLAAFGNSAPPGTIALNDSLYYDRSEVANFSWLEYEFWVMSVFGRESEQHRAVLPDTSVWDRSVAYGEPYRSSYLRHPAYRNYPTVGVTCEQVLAYSKWRSDRVMEYYLVRAGVIPFRHGQATADYFSIEGFYATDSLKAYHHLPYPSYTLPTHAEWRVAVAVADSLAHVNLPRCKKLRTSEFRGASFGECSELVKKGQFIINSRKGIDQAAGDATTPTYCSRCEADLIWQLRGNVSELSADSSLVLGGGWTDPLDSIILDSPLPSHAPDVATGFRNACHWRKWDGVRR